MSKKKKIKKLKAKLRRMAIECDALIEFNSNSHDESIASISRQRDHFAEALIGVYETEQELIKDIQARIKTTHSLVAKKHLQGILKRLDA